MKLNVPETKQIEQILGGAKHVLILQANNPDADSLGSSLALEQILAGMGKQTTLYCGIALPLYLHYLAGWDRVVDEIPKDFDVSIFVDCSSLDLFESLSSSLYSGQLATRPSIVLDHHATTSSIPYATLACNYPVSATAELIFEVASQLKWKLNVTANSMIVSSIMGDTLGLSTESTTARTIQIVASAVEAGASMAKLDAARREYMKKKPEIVKYKGELLQRIEYYDDNRIAVITIPWEEIQKYSYDYNPSMLVIDEMRMTIGTEVAVAFKTYSDGKITAKIRCNLGYNIAGKLAEFFGGGGHSYASGFKITDGRGLDEIKKSLVAESLRLLKEIEA